MNSARDGMSAQHLMAPDSLAEIAQLQALARLVRFQCLAHTPAIPSVYLAASLATADVLTGLLFGGSFRFDFRAPARSDNDRLIIAAPTVAPLSKALWAVATRDAPVDNKATALPSSPPWLASHSSGPGVFDAASPTAANSPASTPPEAGGSPRHTFLLFDGHTITDSARSDTLQLAGRHRLPGLVGIISITRRSRRSVKGAISRDLAAYARRIAAAGWNTHVIDGHDFPQIRDAFREATAPPAKPALIIARTLISDDLSFLDEQRHNHALDSESWAHALTAFATSGLQTSASSRPPPRPAPGVLTDFPT